MVVHTPNLNAQEPGAGGLKVLPGLQSETLSQNSIVDKRNQINRFMPWVLSIRLQGSDSQRLREIHQGKLVERRSLFFETRTANQAGGIQTADVKQETGPSETEGPSQLPGPEQASMSSGLRSRWVPALCLLQIWNTGLGGPGSWTPHRLRLYISYSQGYLQIKSPPGHQVQSSGTQSCSLTKIADTSSSLVQQAPQGSPN